VPRKKKTKTPKAKPQRIIFAHQRKASQRSKRVWEKRWTKAAAEGKPLGPKGREFVAQLGPFRVPSKAPRDEETEVQYLAPRKASRFIYVEEPINRLGGKTRKRKK
jgi:hypothetical protein